MRTPSSHPPEQNATTIDDRRFLSGGGMMGAMMREADWSNSPLGNINTWPQSLRTCVRIILTSSQPMFVWWGKELINLYNDAYLSIIGGKHPQAFGMPAAQVWHEIWDEVGPRADTAMRDNVGTYDEALLLIMERNNYPEETYYTFSYSPVPGDDGNVGGIICANTDDTQRIIGERQLRTLKDLGNVLPGAGTVGEIYTHTINVLQGNRRDIPFALIYELAQETNTATMVAMTSDDLPPAMTAASLMLGSEDDEMAVLLNAAIASGTIYISENIAHLGRLPAGPWQQSPERLLIIPISRGGQKMPFALLVVGLNPYRQPDEKYLGFFSLVADQVAAGIANVRTLEEERKRAEALMEIDRAKTTFFSNISHEFRTPLTLMLGPLESLLAEQQLSEAHRGFIDTTHRNAMRLLRLVNSLLDFSRIEAGRMQASFTRTDIAAYTRDLASGFRSMMENAGLQFDVQCNDIASDVYVDMQMWEKIVLNLLSNAFKYTFTGAVKVLLDEEDGYVVLCVADTGIGIPEAELPKMFDRFHRVQEARGRTHEGTGIGLSLIKELIKLHGGDISVSSREGHGSVFTVKIPVGKLHLSPAQLTGEGHWAQQDSMADIYLSEANSLIVDNDQPGHAATDTPDLNRNHDVKDPQHVLVVDDNADMRRYVSGLLSRDYIVATAANGSEALDKIRARMPDLVVSDIMMPVMDGVALLHTIKNDPATASLPVILLSARAGEEARIEGYDTGADDYLVKPFSAKELQARVRAQLRLAHKQRRADAHIYNLFVQAPVAIGIFMGPSFIIDMVNDRMLEEWGRKYDEVIHKPLFEALPEVSGQGYREKMQQVFTTGIRYVSDESPLSIMHNGRVEKTYIKYILEPLREEDGTISGVMSMSSDITDLYTAKEKLQDAEERMRMAAEGTGLATWELDLETRRVIYTPRLPEILGYDRDAAITHEMMRDRIIPEDRMQVVDKAFSTALKTGCYEYEARIHGRNDELRWVRTQGRVIYDNDGKPLRMLGTMIDITDAKNTSLNIARLAAIVQSSDDAIISKTLDGIVTTWNEAATRILGYTEQEMIGQPIRILMPPGREYEETDILEALQTGRRTNHIETQRITKDGRMLDVSITVSPLLDENGTLVGASKILRDITGQKLAERALRESEARFRTMADTAPVMIWIADPDKHYNFFNRRWLDFTGLTMEQALHTGWSDLVHPDDLQRCMDIYNEALEGAASFEMEYRLRRHDGVYRWVLDHGVARYSPEGQVAGYIGSCIDIHERKEASEELERRVVERTAELSSKNDELQEQKDFVETILDASVDIIVVLDKELNFVALNNKAVELYGDDTVGKNMLETFADIKETPMYDDLQRTLAGETVHVDNYDMPLLNRNFENYYIPLKDTNGQVREIMLISHDITDYMKATQELKKMNEALVKSNNELEQFAYVSSHDLQEPLRKIQTFSDLLNRNLDHAGFDARRYIEKINASAERMATLIKDLLSYSKLSRTNDQVVTVDLQQILEDVKNDFELVIRQKQARIRSMPLPQIKGIPIQINQLFYNLIGNALKFSENAPVIDISCSHVSRHQLLLLPRLHPRGNYIELRFRDNGIGFEQVYAEKIFTIFQRLNDRQQYTGTGIGLAICKRIAENHGGYIEAFSRPGEGATFVIYMAV